MSKIVPIIFLVGSGLMFFFIIDPIYNGKEVSTPDTPVENLGIKDIRERKDAYDNVLASAKELHSKRDALQNKYKSITKADIDKLEEMLPDSLDNVKLVLDMDRMASTWGLRIRNIAVSGGDESDKKQIGGGEKGFGSATITFSISAPYDVFLGFLGDLEDGLRLIDITALTISPKDPRSYDFSVTLKTYWLKK